VPYALAIHTTTPELGLAISSVGGAVLDQPQSRSQTWALDRALSSQLHHYLAEFLQPQTWADLAFLAVAIGPGGYTGTRIGVVTARTLAQQLGCPLFAISSLAAAAWVQGAKNLAESDWAVQMSAQRGELYTAIYSKRDPHRKGYGLTAHLPDTVMTLTQWQQTLENWPHSLTLVHADGVLGDSVTAVLELAQLQWQQGLCPAWDSVLPFYGQLYVAEPKS
jgi:tRNA threonylcarbamoyl adenosine modification protein YeaZ